MIYTICSTLLLIGVLGLFAQTLLGVSHGGHTAAHGHGGHAGSGHGHTGHNHHHGHNEERGSSSVWSSVFTLLSPLTFFSMCVGIGATGLLLRPYELRLRIVVLAALVGGILFYGLIVRPIWSLIFRFASTPSLALEGTVAKEAEALSRFDTNGKGLVRLNIDGQLVRILATLEQDENTDQAIQPGDKLLVTSVDGHKNTCRVARF